MEERNNNVYILYAGKDATVKDVVSSIKIHLEKEQNINIFDYQEKEKVDDPEEDKLHKRMNTLNESIANGGVIKLLPLYIQNIDINGFKKQYIELEKISSNIIKKWPEEFIMRINNFIETFEKTEQFNETIEFLKMIMKKHVFTLPNKITHQVKLGDLWEDVGNIKQANKYYAKAIKSNFQYIKNVEKRNEDQIYINLIYKEIEELQRCINSDNLCNRKEYVICQFKDDNNSKIDKIVLDEECQEDISNCGDSVEVISQKEYDKLFKEEQIKDNDELFEKYEVDEDNIIDAVEPIR